MFEQPFRSTYLFVPAEDFLRVLRELHVIRRVGINEISRAQRHRLKVPARKIPFGKHLAIFSEVADVVDSLVVAKRNVEFATSVKPTEAIEVGSIQIIKEGRRFCTFRFTVA